MCLLNEQVVFDDVYDLTHGSLVGIVHDQVRVSVFINLYDLTHGSLVGIVHDQGRVSVFINRYASHSDQYLEGHHISTYPMGIRILITG